MQFLFCRLSLLNNLNHVALSIVLGGELAAGHHEGLALRSGAAALVCRVAA